MLDPARSTVTVEPSAVAADGTSSALVTVTVRNGAGDLLRLPLRGPNEAQGVVVVLTASASGTAFGPIGGEEGVYSARVRSTTAGLQTVTATLQLADGTTATLTPASVTFIGSVSATPSASPPAAAASPSPSVLATAARSASPSAAPATSTPTAVPQTAAPTASPPAAAPTFAPTAAPPPTAAPRTPSPSLPAAQGGYVVTSGYVTRQVGFACQAEPQTQISAATLGELDGVGLVLGTVLGPDGQPMQSEVRILTIGASGQAYENRGASPPHCFRILARLPGGTIATGSFRADVYVGTTIIKTYTFTVTP